MASRKIEGRKYKNAILYFIGNIPKEKLGKTKLVKLLYYLDFIYYRDHGRTVTGTFYFKQQFGPLPKDFSEVISCLVKEKKIKVSVTEYGDKEKEGYENLVDSDLSQFTKNEKDLLEKITEKYRNVRTADIVRKSHAESPWLYATFGDELDYGLSADIIDFDEKAEKEIQDEDDLLRAVQV